MEQEDFRRFRQTKIQLFSRTKLRSVFPGEWDSIFAGEGIEFATVKPFEPGDELRDLDLHTLAQSGEEEIIQRVVGRQMRVFVWADLSGSMQRRRESFFSRKPEIRDLAISLLLFSAWNAYSPVGLYAFNRDTNAFFPARGGENHCWEILDWLVVEASGTTGAPANVEDAIAMLMKRVPCQSLVFFVSDFQDQAFERNFTGLLRPATRKVDLVPVIIRDPFEGTTPWTRSANVAVSDSEGDSHAEVYLTPKKLQDMRDASAQHLAHLERTFRQLGIEHVLLNSTSPDVCCQTFSAFFNSRRRTRA
jgi:uncharacterized protein (DUF58 family)